MIKINKKSLEYREGIKEGQRRERAKWVLAMENSKGLGDVLSERVITEVSKIYKGE